MAAPCQAPQGTRGWRVPASRWAGWGGLLVGLPGSASLAVEESELLTGRGLASSSFWNLLWCCTQAGSVLERTSDGGRHAEGSVNSVCGVVRLMTGHSLLNQSSGGHMHPDIARW